MKENKLIKTMLRMKDPDSIFDLILVVNYMAGRFDEPHPIDESRKVFEHIKKLLGKP